MFNAISLGNNGATELSDNPTSPRKNEFEKRRDNKRRRICEDKERISNAIAAAESEGLPLIEPAAIELQTIMRNYVQSLPRELVKNERELHRHMRHVWTNLMRDLFHRYEEDEMKSTVKCSNWCLLNDTVVVLHEASHLYGCWAHGFVHHCEKNMGLCPVRYTGSEEMGVVCAISGRFLGYEQGDDCTYRGDGGNVSDKKSQFDYYQSLRRIDDSRGSGFNVGHTAESRIHKLLENTKAAREAKKAEAVAGEAQPKLLQDTEHNTPQPVVEEPLAPELVQLVKETPKQPPPKPIVVVKKQPQPPPLPPAKPSPVMSRKRRRSNARADADESGTTTSENLIARLTTIEELEEAKLREKEDKVLAKMQRRELLLRSSEVKELSKQAENVGRQLMRTVVGEVLDDLLYDSDTRTMFNRFMRGCITHKAHETIRLAYQNACRERVRLKFFDIVNMLEHYNSQYVEVIPHIERNTGYIETMIRRITGLWELCVNSPFVFAQKHYCESTQTVTVSPYAEDMCSLRQFALACLFDMRDGYSVSVVETKDVITILPCERGLIFELPSESQIRFFGTDAKHELKRHLENAHFMENDFDPARQYKADASMSERSKTRKFTRATSVKSVSLTKSEGIEMSLNNMKQDKKRKRNSRARSTYDDYVQGDRNVAMGNGRVYIGTVGLGGTSVTESQLTPFYMREPMLTAGNKRTCRRRYDEIDLARGRKFKNVALNSYGQKLATLFAARR